MGHTRLGRLPKTLRWREVVELLALSPEDTPGLAAGVVRAADGRLQELAVDRSLTYCFWLLSRIAWASRGADFRGELSRLGIATESDTPVLTFIARLSEHVRRELAGDTASGHFTELASLALRRALTDTVGEQGPSLFGNSVEDLQLAFRKQSTRQQFGSLSRRFFGDFLSRLLRSAIERELSHHVAPTLALSTLSESREVTQALDLYARQSARIVEDFAGGWYSKENWETRGEISFDDAGRFVAVALRKLRMELKLGSA